MAKILLGKKIIAKNAEVANTPLSRMRGLMFREKPCAIWFEFEEEKKWSIHSFFVSFPFDAVFLDAGMGVVDVVSSIPPFTPNVTPKKACKFLLELPEGSVRKLKIKAGDRFMVF